MLGLPAKDWNKYLLDAIADEEAEWKRQDRQEKLDRRGLPPSVPLDKLAGEYVDAAYGTATVELEKDHLVWKWSSWKIPLEHFDADKFKLRTDHGPLKDVSVRFLVKDGVPRAMQIPGVSLSPEVSGQSTAYPANPSSGPSRRIRRDRRRRIPCR